MPLQYGKAGKKFLAHGLHFDFLALSAPSRLRRLIVVSNRLPIVLEKKDGRWTLQPGSGGLVSALAPVLSHRGGLWIGWTLVRGDGSNFPHRGCNVPRVFGPHPGTSLPDAWSGRDSRTRSCGRTAHPRGLVGRMQRAWSRRLRTTP